MHHLFQDQFWKESLAQCCRLKGNIFSREWPSSNQASWHMTTERLMLHFVETEHSKGAMAGDLNDFFIHFRAEPGHVQASKELQFCTCTVRFRRIYFSCTLWGQQCAPVPKTSKWKCSPVEAESKAWTLWSSAFRGADIPQCQTSPQQEQEASERLPRVAR